MRFPVSLSTPVAVLAVLFLCAGPRAHAQAPTQPPAGQPSSPPAGQSSSSVQAPDTPPEPSYVAIDPLANVRYDNRYDVSVGLAYAHIKAGPNLAQGSNLGGLDISGSTG